VWREEGQNSHLAVPPLHLLNYVQATVHDELVHVPSLLREPRLSVPALLAGAELMLEERVILRADYAEVIRHDLEVPGGKAPAFRMGRGN
jgi:hypothetical protein